MLAIIQNGEGMDQSSLSVISHLHDGHLSRQYSRGDEDKAVPITALAYTAANQFGIAALQQRSIRMLLCVSVCEPCVLRSVVAARGMNVC